MRAWGKWASVMGLHALPSSGDFLDAPCILFAVGSYAAVALASTDFVGLKCCTTLFRGCEKAASQVRLLASLLPAADAAPGQ